MEKKELSWGRVFILIGALMAFLIGSGFASGQETVQYFTGYGVVGGFLVGTFNFVMIYIAYVAYAYAGRTRNLRNLNEVATFYAGPVVGKACETMAWLFTFCCYFFMSSGAATTMNQQWGLPMPIGLAIFMALVLIVTILGLTKIVDVIGCIGPVITLFTLVVGIISAFTYFPQIPEGQALLDSGAVTISRGTNHWITAGLSFGGCSLLLCSNFVATLGYENREYKFGRFKLVLLICAILDSYVSVLMGFNHLGNVAESAVAPIPNLVLANHILGSVGTLFAIIILLAIYSTCCPLLWNSISFFTKEDSSKKYKLLCVGMTVLAYIVCLFIPYQTLLGVIMTYCGYGGAIVFFIIAFCYFRQKKKDKLEGIEA